MIATIAAPAAELFDQAVKPLLEARCMACHGAQAASGGLALTSRESLLSGGNRGAAVIPGDPDASLLIQAVRQTGDLKMPPGGALSAEEQGLLARWVQTGAEWGGASEAANEKPVHWSFQPVAHPAPPKAAWPDKARNPIDQFVQSKLQKAGLAPSPEADRPTLIRRLSLDITGLPPTPEEVRAFVEDTRPDAYEQLVDRLFASPHYGERWARHWLDIAHYADSNGYNIDGPRQMWMYRDWVIAAINRDEPFDQFVIEQIAGDLLPKPSKEQLIATGFHRNTLINLEGGIDFEQYRVEAVVDRVDTVGQAFLGLTLGCARCHTHKYDPISQKEFYQMYAFYDSIDELSGADGEEGRQHAFKPLLEFGAPDELLKRDVIQAQVDLLQKDLSAYEKELDPKQAEWEASLSAEDKAKLGDEIQFVLSVPAKDRNSIQNESLARVYHGQDLGWSERQASINAVRKRLPDLDTTMIMRERAEPRESYIHLGGDFLRKGVTVQPGTPAALPALHAAGARPTRLDFAKWLMSDENPLTPRVTVNRVWQRYFGMGIVETENDFGTQGAPPSHPELLDWLASWYRDNGWKTKDLHRLIVTSYTYRQASHYRDDSTEADPRNKLLSRQNRLRLEAE
ncbi:MAG: PSD1 domain-containing protein, partial [Acidobacteria bacterium]|nr:PSD1 domain-containing protein [Acidobacteriota bacterium]